MEEAGDGCYGLDVVKKELAFAITVLGLCVLERTNIHCSMSINLINSSNLMF